MCLSHSAPSTDPPRPETVPPAAPRNGPLGLPPLAQYTVPFAGFLFFLVLADWVPLNPYWDAPLRVILLGLLCWLCWPRDQKLAPNRWMQSTIVGIAVFLLWIAPEVLIPGWRMLPPFHNSVVGAVHSSLPGDALRSPWVLTWRTARAALIVPVVEELFWRGFLMRWLIGSHFERIPMGTYRALAFWIVVALFAIEHGPYWEVGLLTGIIYNWWMVRTKSLGDCIWMHAVTNLCLSIYVIAANQWQYWQ